MMRSKNIRLGLRLTIALFAILTLAVQPSVSAITQTDLKAILNQTPFYGDVATSGSCSNTSSDTTLSGDGAIQQGFNYFVGKLTAENSQEAQVQAAAIIGNFRQESSMNPRSNQGGGGAGRGIAQWSVDGRWVNLLKYAGAKKLDERALATQLDFVWMELHGTPPAGDYSGALAKLKQETTVEGATTIFETEYEAAGDPVMPRRIEYANDTLAKYGNGTNPTSAVSGTDASCTSSTAINCDSTTGSTGSLDQTRQNVVCLAQSELALWTSGKMKPGTNFFKYGATEPTEQWCADFVSWIYNKAGYPIDKNAQNGRVASVDQIKAIGDAGGRFKYHDKAGYTPIPGDIVVYKTGWSHVNLVVSVNTNQKSMNTIGGNEGGAVQGVGTDSSVKGSIVKYTDAGDAYASHINGYVSPETTQ